MNNQSVLSQTLATIKKNPLPVLTAVIASTLTCFLEQAFYYGIPIHTLHHITWDGIVPPFPVILNTLIFFSFRTAAYLLPLYWIFRREHPNASPMRTYLKQNWKGILFLLAMLTFIGLNGALTEAETTLYIEYAQYSDMRMWGFTLIKMAHSLLNICFTYWLIPYQSARLAAMEAKTEWQRITVKKILPPFLFILLFSFVIAYVLFVLQQHTASDLLIETLVLSANQLSILFWAFPLYRALLPTDSAPEIKL